MANGIKGKIEKINKNILIGKNEIAKSISNKGIETNFKDSFKQMSENIDKLKSEDLIGKQELVEMLILKSPNLEGEVDINTPLSDISYYFSMIGLIPIKLKDYLKFEDLNNIILNDNAEINLIDVLYCEANESLNFLDMKNLILNDKVEITLE